MYLSVSNGAGSLLGPLIGGALWMFAPKPKILYTWGAVGAVMLISLVLFLIAFRDVR